MRPRARSGGPASETEAEAEARLQDMLDNPGLNFGWILLGDEITPRSARALGSREDPIASQRPTLTIEYDYGWSNE